MLIALIVLVHGAAITSLGLAIATWIPHPGRAVSLTVVAYALVSVGWAVMVVTLVEHGPRDALRLADLSPMFASVHLCDDMLDHPKEVAWTCASVIFWLHLVAGAVVLFYSLTVANFDRCLGRTSE